MRGSILYRFQCLTDLVVEFLHVFVIALPFDFSSSDSFLHIDQLGDKSDELRVEAVFLLFGNWGISFNLVENLKNKIYVFCWSLDVHCLSLYI